MRSERGLVAAVLGALVALPTGAQSVPPRPPVVTSASPVWTAQTRWRVPSRPTADIPHDTTDGALRLTDVRFAARLTNGLFVVADRASQSLQFARADGRIVAVVGGDGGPPRREVRLGNVFRCGSDTLWIFRGNGGVLQEVLPTGQPGREVRLTVNGTAGTFNPETCGRGGILAVTGPGDDPTPPERGPYRVSHRVATFSLQSGNRIADLGALAVADLDASPSAAFNRNQLFGRRRVQAIGENDLYFGMGDTWEITVSSLNGRERRTWRLNRPTRTLTPADTARLREMIVRDASPAMRQSYLSALAHAALPQTFPAYSAMLIDTHGNLWVREYDFRNTILNVSLPIPYARATPQFVNWVVVDPSGRWLGDVRIPPTFRVFEIGSDYVLGTQQGDDRVNRLQMLPLIKP